MSQTPMGTDNFAENVPSHALVASQVRLSPIEIRLGKTTDEIEGSAEVEFSELLQRMNDRIRACMANEAFEYFTSANPDQNFLASAASYVADPAALSLEERQVSGYGIVDETKREIAQEKEKAEKLIPAQEYLSALSAEERNRYNAVLSRCSDEAFTAEMERQGAPDLMEVLGEELFDLERAIEADDRYVAAAEQWRSCARENGYEYDSYTLMLRSLGEQTYESLNSSASSASELRAEEIVIATKLFKCDVAWGNAVFEVRTDLENQFLQKHELVFAEFN